MMQQSSDGSIEILKFRYNEKNSLCALSKTGLVCYPHYKSKGIIDREGIWLCKVVYKSNCCFAEHLTSEPLSFSDLISNADASKIARIVWEEYPDEVMPLMDDYIDDHIKSVLKDKDATISELQTKLMEAENSVDESIEDISDVSCFPVHHIAEDKLQCEYFSGKYSLKLSADLKLAVLYRDSKGHYSAFDHTLTIPGFGQLVDFQGECDIIGSMQKGGIQLSLIPQGQ